MIDIGKGMAMKLATFNSDGGKNIFDAAKFSRGLIVSGCMTVNQAGAFSNAVSGFGVDWLTVERIGAGPFYCTVRTKRGNMVTFQVGRNGHASEPVMN